MRGLSSRELLYSWRATRYRMVVTKGGQGGAVLFAFPDLWLHYCVELSNPVSVEWLRENGAPRREAKVLADIINAWFAAQAADFTQATMPLPEPL